MKKTDKRTDNLGRPKTKDRYKVNLHIDTDLKPHMRVQENQSNLVNRLLRKHFKLGVIAILLMFLFSCDNRESQSKEKVGDFELELLFEKDGCKMYRFYTGSRYVYWANCEGKVNFDYQTTSSNGKTTMTIQHRGESITTKK